MQPTDRSAAFLGALSAQSASLACLVVAYFKRDAAHAEGAYFNRSVGESAVAVAFQSDVRPWLVATFLLGVTSVALWLAERSRHR